MKNYIDEIYTVSEFKRDNPELSNQAEKALQYLKGHCPNSEDAIFVVIEVESYHCIAYLTEPPSGARNKLRFQKILRRKHHGKLFQNNRISPRQKYLRRL